MPDATIIPTPDPLLQTLKRCRPEVVNAAVNYRESKDVRLLPVIVLGVLERFIEPECRPLLRLKDTNELKLQADLGMDSLVMMEVVMTLEEIFGQSIPDTELRGLYTIGDTLAYVTAKTTGAPLPEAPDRLPPEMLPIILGAEVSLVREVVLRSMRAEAIYAGEVASTEELMRACVQLVGIWANRKGGGQKLTPVVTGDVVANANKSIQLRLEKDGTAWNVYWLQTGKPAVGFGRLR